MIALLCFGGIAIIGIAVLINIGQQANQNANNAAASAAPPPTKNIAKQLLEAQQMVEDGLITEDEYKELKKRIIRDS